MKRYLLLVIAFVCVSIGTWAGPAEGFEMKKDDVVRWWFARDANLGVEKVIKIEVSRAGGLKNALDELTVILDGTGNMQHQIDFRNKLNQEEHAHGDVYNNFIANKKLVLQVVNTSGGALTLDANDLAALASIDIPTIDLQDLNPSAPFTFANPNVKRVILPDGWDKTAVTAASEAIIAVNDDFESAYSIDGPNGAVVAYVNKPGTLYTAMRHMYTFGEQVGDQLYGNFKLGTASVNNFNLTGLTDITLLGTPSARDFSGGTKETHKFDENGHLVFDRAADETSTEKDAGIGGTRQLTGTPMDGAIVGAQLARLDLGDAIIYDDYNSDLTISWSYSAVSTTLREIIFPTTSELKTLPADCLNGDYRLLEEFCIPGNIEVLKTRACWISTQVVRHIWTTGSNPDLIYDYGAYTVHPTDRDNPAVFDHYGHAPLTSDVWNCGKSGETYANGGVPRFGTITLPENLKLIESHCFTARNVSDVYSLNPVAPECHVDAFSTIMYLGNNTIDTQYIQEMGMVTREAYAQSVAKGEYITFLHYPRGIGTPEIQRYTDPTREFSIATTLRDGKGNVIYFPNQSELNRAYIQGTTGYLWYAWDSKRVPEEHGGDANSFEKANPSTSNGHTTQLQQLANDLYIANEMTNPDKTDRSFYDVRLDGNGQPTLEKPSGLDWYWQTVWEGQNLYPLMQNALSEEIIGQVQKHDANDKPVYEECSEGNFVKSQHYVHSAQGTYVNVPMFDGYVGTTTAVPEIDTYYSDSQGQEEVTPKVSGSFYVEDGTKPVYSSKSYLADRNYDGQYYSYDQTNSAYTPVTPALNQTYYYATGNQVAVTTTTKKPISGVDTYYSDAAATTTSTPQFNTYNTYYYTTGEFEDVPVYTGTSQPVSNVTVYYDANHNEVVPNLPNWGSFYVLNGGSYDRVYTYTPGVNYYVSWDGGSTYQSWAPQFDTQYYYISGYNEVQKYIPTTEFVSGCYTYYVQNSGYQEYTQDLFATDYYIPTGEMKDEYLATTEWNRTRTYYTIDNQTGAYTEVTGDMYFNQEVCQVVGSEPNYSSADGQYYSAYVKYYTDATGETEASSVSFDNTYYYASYTDNFVEYTGQEGDRYDLVEYYREATAEDGNAQRYCPVMEDVYGIIKSEYTADYRGWHQFVLAAYAPYGDPEENTVVKFYQTDSDWWTVCLPYDLRHSEMKRFFGNGNNIPYLSKLRYVVRDYDKRKITLMFSKNLMVYKENIDDDPIKDYVHGDIDDTTEWTAAELENDPIILHKGVPYLIKPQIPVGANRSFDVAKSTNPDLYKRLVDAENVPGGALETYIYKGEYTVPAYVVGTDASEQTVTQRTFDHYGDYSKTYYSANPIKYDGQDINAEISDVYSYTFVGTFFLSVLPHDCYFLGWDSQKNRAAFWYNKVPKLDKYEWNNQTGVIVANFDRANTLIHSATSLADPARWLFAASSNENDNLLGAAGNLAKKYDMGYGGAIQVVIDDSENPLAEDFGDQDVLSIDEIQSLDVKGEWYNLKGQKLNGRPTQSGVYIMNSKKYVVK